MHCVFVVTHDIFEEPALKIIDLQLCILLLVYKCDNLSI